LDELNLQMSAMKPGIGRLSVVAFASLIALSGPQVRSEVANEYLAGKQISLFIGTTAGGGYDLYARTLARHIARHIPGHPSIIAKNMPGAGGLTLANYLYNRAVSDGSELATVQNGLPFEKLFQTLSADGKNALFDATKFGWIGSIMQTVFVTVTWHASGVKTLQEATMKEVVLGASATSSDSYILAMLSNNLLGTKFKVVHGYAGAAEVDLAVENGEVQGKRAKIGARSLRRDHNGSATRKLTSSFKWALKHVPTSKACPRPSSLPEHPTIGRSWRSCSRSSECRVRS